ADGDVATDVRIGLEDHAFSGHQVQPPIEMALLHLEFRYAVAQQATDAIRSLEDRDRVARAIELLRGGEPRRSRSDDGDSVSCTLLGRRRRDPTFLEGAIDDRHFDGLDADRIVVDAEHAGALARSRTQATRELRKVVGRVQAIDCRAPAVTINEV